MNEIIDLNVNSYINLYGLAPARHPLVEVVDLKKATKVCNHVRMNYECYALYLKNDENCRLKYGRKEYDYQQGTIVSFAPGQIIGVDTEEDEFQPDVYGILFHPDLIYNSNLGKKIDRYTFFDYAQNEALHLSEHERQIIIDCLHKIEYELEHPVDKHSRELLSVHIELLLDYCLRFYDRQFYTREKANNDYLTQFEQLLNGYFTEENIRKNGVPTVSYFAGKICLSPGYFGDLIKKETGRTAQEYIQRKIISLSKLKLQNANLSVSEIAYSLGFQHPQHFIRLFKRETGLTPRQWREQSA